MTGQSCLRQKGGVMGASDHAPRQRNGMYGNMVRQYIHNTRRPKHPHLPVRLVFMTPRYPYYWPCYTHKVCIPYGSMGSQSALVALTDVIVGNTTLHVRPTILVEVVAIKLHQKLVVPGMLKSSHASPFSIRVTYGFLMKTHTIESPSFIPVASVPSFIRLLSPPPYSFGIIGRLLDLLPPPVPGPYIQFRHPTTHQPSLRGSFWCLFQP